MKNRNCSIRDTTVFLREIHPDSLPVPDDGAEFSVRHYDCEFEPDDMPSDGESDDFIPSYDDRAWIIYR